MSMDSSSPVRMSAKHVVRPMRSRMGGFFDSEENQRGVAVGGGREGAVFVQGSLL